MRTTPSSSPQVVRKGMLLEFEQTLLRRLVTRLPRAFSRGHARAITLVGAMIAVTGYALSYTTPAALWLASAGLAMNWTGASLMLQLAALPPWLHRNRAFWVDRAMDMVGDLSIGAGLCLSGLIRAEIVGSGVLVYLLATSAELHRAVRLGVVLPGPGGIGPTEVRLAFVLLNVLLFLVPPAEVQVFAPLSYADFLGLCWLALYSIHLARLLLGNRSLRVNS
jgi:archaetidylinositol phosphate synthase